AELRDDVSDAPHALVRHLFPTRFLRMPGLETALAYAAPGMGNQVGGDIIDAYRLSNGTTSFSIADISGKGMHAAVNAALVKFALRAYASEGYTPERVLQSLNRFYIENNTYERTDSHLTAFFGLVDSARSRLTYASAGHEPIVVCHHGQAPLVLRPTAPMIGVDDGSRLPFAQASIPLQIGTVLVVTTDGVTEARAPDGECFGMERLRDCVRRNVDRSVENQVATLLRETEAFCQGPFRDDIAILVARFL
ncbi:MAG: PP2C family protein-serine/threonine phosphatase, partial [Vulcanimicrobiaceae bacterium]